MISGIVDFHSHVLPGIDDGSASVAESVSMLRMEVEQGICHVIATPHFYPDRDTPKCFLQSRAAAEAQLREEMARHENLPMLSVGAEVHYFPGISESEILPVLTIAEKKCILIEMPNTPWPESIYRELEGIYVKHGITPIVAHIDRYIHPLRTYGIPKRLAELPVLVQANGSFFCNRATRTQAMRLLQNEAIHLLGSDCHNMRTRVPNLGVAVETIYNRFGQSALMGILEFQNYALK